MSEQCRKPGCTLSRLSVFCEEHHREQLVRAGLIQDPPPDPSRLLVRVCESHVRSYDCGAITPEELCASLFDYFIHLHNEGLDSSWGPALDSLPLPIKKDLLAYASARSEPRLFAPVPRQERKAAEEAARTAQAELVAQLAARCGGVG